MDVYKITSAIKQFQFQYINTKSINFQYRTSSTSLWDVFTVSTRLPVINKDSLSSGTLVEESR